MDEKILVLEKMPEEPKYQKIPTYFLPTDLNKIPEFEVVSSPHTCAHPKHYFILPAETDIFCF